MTIQLRYHKKTRHNLIHTMMMVSQRVYPFKGTHEHKGLSPSGVSVWCLHLFHQSNFAMFYTQSCSGSIQHFDTLLYAATSPVLKKCHWKRNFEPDFLDLPYKGGFIQHLCQLLPTNIHCFYHFFFDVIGREWPIAFWN